MSEETKPQITLETRIQQYVALRDKIKEQDDKHKKAMAPAREALEQLNNVILNALNNAGGDSIKTKHGTAYKTVKRSASLEDPEKFMSFVIKKELFDLLERKVSITAAEQYADENGVLPPGVKVSSKAVVGVRRS